MYRLDPSRLVFLHLAGKRRMRAAESKLPPKPILKLLQNMAKGAKNSMKLSRIVNGKGNLKKASILRINVGPYDYGGELKFEFKDGSSFLVKNKTVFKRSHLGTPFYQFPTTFHNVVLPDGSKMSGVNEKTMLEVFAGVSATGR